MRPRLLRAFGWQVESVLAKDWYENQEQEFVRLLAILESGESAAGDDDGDEIEDSAGADEDEPADELADEPAAAIPAEEPDAVDELELASSAETTSAIEIANESSHPAATASLVPVPTARRFEFREGKSSKFWEIAVNGHEHTVRFGRIGSNGQSQTKSFPSASAAQNDADRLIAEKKRKGYRETSG
jgi:predicted DNA-binding WGR domain protein